MIRAGRHVGDRSFFPSNAEGAAQDEVISAFLEQHYLDQPAPALVVTSEPVELDNINVVNPSHGERKIWLDMARKNALLAIAQRVRDRATQEGPRRALEALGLPEFTQRIECSHQPPMREATVASCGYHHRRCPKSEYRRFTIAGCPGGRHAAMRQVLTRRSEPSARERQNPDPSDRRRKSQSAARILSPPGPARLRHGVAKGRSASGMESGSSNGGAQPAARASHPSALIISPLRSIASRVVAPARGAQGADPSMRTRFPASLEARHALIDICGRRASRLRDRRINRQGVVHHPTLPSASTSTCTPLLIARSHRDLLRIILTLC